MVEKVLIPYQQGSLFRQELLEQLNATSTVLIPYQQGSLFRRKSIVVMTLARGLNPLSAGKSVQTVEFGLFERPTTS